MGKVKTKAKKKEKVAEKGADERADVQIPESVEAVPEDAEEFTEKYVGENIEDQPTYLPKEELVQGEVLAEVEDETFWKALIPAETFGGEPVVIANNGEFTVLTIDEGKVVGAVVKGYGKGHGSAKVGISKEIVGRAVRCRVRKLCIKDNGRVQMDGSILVNKEKSVDVRIATQCLPETDSYAERLEEIINGISKDAKYVFNVEVSALSKVVKELLRGCKARGFLGHFQRAELFLVNVGGRLAVYGETVNELFVAPVCSTAYDDVVLGSFDTEYFDRVLNVFKKYNVEKVEMRLQQGAPVVFRARVDASLEVVMVIAPNYS